MTATTRPYLFLECNYINPLSDKSTEVVFDGAIVLKPTKSGYSILKKGERSELWRVMSQKNLPLKKINRRGLIAFPGFVDTHFHWVQDDVRLMPKDSLMTWLQEYTWPYEEKFQSKTYTKERAKSFAKELLAVGTLGGLCYGSLHQHSVEIALEEFKGEFVLGNVLMTMNSPESLQQTVDEAMEINSFLSKKYGKRYALTPRFAPTTHPEVMAHGADLAHKRGNFIQTHLSENIDEIEFVLNCFRAFPKFKKLKDYTEIYEKLGLLGPKTILGHCIHLSDREWKIIQKTQTAIAHCPSSNAPVNERGLGSGLFDLRRAEKLGVRWCLASDIGGGPYLSMFDVMHSFVTQHQRAGVHEATYQMALYRATASGADFLNQAKKLGRLDVGTEANLFLIDTPKNASTSPEELLASICESFLDKREHSNELVYETYLQGKAVYRKKIKT